MRAAILFLISVFFCPIFANREQALSAINELLVDKLEFHTLDNGLRVILVQNKLSPTIAAYIKIGVGSANEPFDQAGTAHFLEHLLFKGTEQLGTVNYAKERPALEQLFADGNRLDALRLKLKDPLISESFRKQLKDKEKKLKRRMGIWENLLRPYTLSEEDSLAYEVAGQSGYNAYTSSDVTNYQVKLPSHRLELWAALESARFTKPVLREFYRERSVIQEERRMRIDSRPPSRLYELYLKTAFGLSPYGKPVIGTESSIPSLTHQGTTDFFYNNYGPERMVVALVGNIEPASTFKLIKKYFERIPPRNSGYMPPFEFKPTQGLRTANLKVRAAPYMLMGWYRPPITHPDYLSFEVLDSVLTGGKSSRLNKSLVLEEKLTSNVFSYVGAGGSKLTGSFVIGAYPYKEESYDVVVKKIKDQLKQIAQNGITDLELDRVKNEYLSALLSSLQTNAGLAEALTYYEVQLNDYKALTKKLDRINKITSADIQRIIKKYFTEDYETRVFVRNATD